MCTTLELVIDGKTRRFDMTQLALLNAAMRRETGALLPAPSAASENPEVVELAVASLVRRGMASMEGETACITSVAVHAMLEADPHGGPIACCQALELTPVPERYDPDAVAERATASSAMEPTDSAPAESAPSSPAESVAPAPDQLGEVDPVPSADATSAACARPTPRKPSKLTIIADALTQPTGASLDELTTATGWLPHSVRAGMTGLRKQGHTIARTSVDGITRFAITANG